MTEQGTETGNHGDGDRRDFLKILAVATGAVGAAGVVWAFGASLGPGEGARDLSVFDVDLTPIAANSAITVQWRGKPVFIRHLTETQLDAVKATDMKKLIDPASVKHRTKPGHEQWAVFIGLCPDGGCIPIGTASSDERGPYDGWLCPCDGSAFDAVGRVRRGPAKRNLAIPPYRFVSDTLIRLG